MSKTNAYPLKVTSCPSYSVRICIAGNRDDAMRICRQFCLDVGLCVTVEAAEYVYTGGQESGVVIGLINYPRFPTTLKALIATAGRLGEELMEGMFQQSFCVVGPAETVWYSRRPE